MLPKGKTCGKGTINTEVWFTGDSWELPLKVLHFLIWVSVSQSACARVPLSAWPQCWFLGPTKSESSGTRLARVDALIRPDTHHSCTLLQNPSASIYFLHLRAFSLTCGAAKLSDPRSGPQLMTEESREAVPWPPDPSRAETDLCPARCHGIPWWDWRCCPWWLSSAGSGLIWLPSSPVTSPSQGPLSDE